MKEKPVVVKECTRCGGYYDGELFDRCPVCGGVGVEYKKKEQKDEQD